MQKLILNLSLALRSPYHSIILMVCSWIFSSISESFNNAGIRNRCSVLQCAKWHYVFPILLSIFLPSHSNIKKPLLTEYSIQKCYKTYICVFFINFLVLSSCVYQACQYCVLVILLLLIYLWNACHYEGWKESTYIIGTHKCEYNIIYLETL